MTVELREFDPINYLTTDAQRAEFLRVVIEDGTDAEIVEAARDVVRSLTPPPPAEQQG